MASHDVYYAHILSKNQRGYTEDMKIGRLNRASFAKIARRAMLLFAFAALGAQAAAGTVSVSYELNGKTVSFTGATLREVNDKMRTYWEVSGDGCAYNAAKLPADRTGTLTWTVSGTVEQGDYLNEGALVLPSLSGGYIYRDGTYQWKKIEVKAAAPGATIISSQTFDVHHSYLSTGTDTTTVTGVTLQGGLYVVPRGTVTFDGCTFTGQLRVPNGDGAFAVTGCTFTGATAAQDSSGYVMHYQASGTLAFTGNTVADGYKRGLNIDNEELTATVEKNKLGTTTEAGRSAIQISRCVKLAVTENEIKLDGGNAFTFHKALLDKALLGLSAAPEVSISGNTVTGTGYLIYDDAVANEKEFTSDNLKLTYATDNEVAATVETTRGVKEERTYGISTVVNNEVQHYVATVGTTGYTTLAAALAAVAEGKPLTWVAEGAWPVETPVYYNGTFYEKGTGFAAKGALERAIDAANAAKAAAVAKIYVRPGFEADELVLQAHQQLKTGLAIYGNDAKLARNWEPCVEYPGTSGDSGAHQLTKDVSLAIYNLHNGAGFWGRRTTAYTVDLKLSGCRNAYQVMFYGNADTGVKGKTNISVTNCTFDATTKADHNVLVTIGAGTVDVSDTTFTAANINVKNVDGGDNVITVKGCTFKDTVAGNQNIRVRSYVEGTHADLTIENVTFTGDSTQNVEIGDSKAECKGVVSYTITQTSGTLNVYKQGATAVETMTLDAAAEQPYTGSNVAENDGSEAHPYSREQFAAMTRTEYIAAQKRLGGTLYVNVGDYAYGTAGVLGNGVRNDTPGQVPDLSKLNAYGENGYLGEENDGANGHAVVFVGGTITSGVTGYTSIDNIGTSILLAVPAYTKVTFKGTAFKNVLSFDYQLYTSPWSQLGGLTFQNCTFDGIIVGAIAAQELAFNGCTFNNYENTTSANNSNPTWIRPAYGNWTKGDNEGQSTGFRSLTKITFENNTVTSTRPVKFERIAQWEMATTVKATGNKFTITPQEGDTSTKNVGLYFGANAKFDLVIDSNAKSGATAALYTAVYSAPTGVTYVGLPAGSTVKNAAGDEVVTNDALAWKTNDQITLKTTTAVASVTNANGVSVNFATLADAFAAATAGQTVTLLADVDMTGTEWTPIDNFTGTFDGAGHTIKNLVVANNENYTGFFNVLKGTVKDVTFEYCKVTGQRCGILAGAADTFTAQNVVVKNCEIVGSQKCGGLVGYVRNNNPATVTGCQVNGLQIKGADADGVWQAGGLLGFVQTVKGTVSRNTVSGISIEDAYKKYLAGGAAPTRQYASHAFIAVIVNTSNGRTYPADADHTLTISGNSVEQCAETMVYRDEHWTSFCGDYADWEGALSSSNPYPTKLVIDGVEVTAPVAKIGTNFYGSLEDAVAVVQDGETITVLNYDADNMTAPDGWKFETVDGVTTLVADPVLVKGEDGMFHIASYDDLLLFKKMVNEKEMNFSGETVVLDADISCTETWTAAIGPFHGTFDGNNKKISNLKVNATANYAGLFGCVFGAKIKDLNLVGTVVSTTGENYAGALVGGGYAHIENCSVTGSSVTGVDQVGGVIGYLSCGSVKNCTVDGVAVTANGDRAGGIAGKANVDSEYEISGNMVKDATIVAAKKIGEMRSAAGLVGQVMASASKKWSIKDNTILNTTTKTGDDTTFVPVGEFRNGNYQADAVTAGHIVNNHWEPATPDAYDMKNPANAEQFVTIENYWEAKTVVVTDTASAQAALDAATPNTTIIFKAGTYGPLFIRQTLEKSTRRSDLDKDGSYPAYLRSFKNLTLIAEEGAVVVSKGITAEAGLFWHASAPASNQAEMRPMGGFISYLALENVTIDGIAFDSTEQSAVTLRDNGAVPTRGNIMVDGLTIQNCTGRGVASNKNIHFLAAGAGTNDQNFPGTEKKAFNNLVVKNCELDSYYQPIAFNNATAVLNGLTVTGNTFSNNGNSNVLQLSNKVNSGAFVIENNLFKYLNGRVVRATTSTANWTITGNRLDKPIMYDDSGEYDLVKINVKAETVGTAVTELDNDWNVGTLVNGTYIADGDPALLPVARIGETRYYSLQDAIDAATAGQTVTLLKDLTDTDKISLKAGVTLDGDGHKVTGNSAVYINKAGGTVQNVVFEDIHNAANNLSAVYASGLEGTATITGCTFDNCDWDAIQATPVAGAVLTITGNVFDTDNTDGVQQQRYVHIQSAANVDFTSTVTGNVMKGDTKQGALEAYFFADEEKINVSHNYIEDMADVCILDGTGALRNDMVFPAYKDAEKTELYQPVAMIATSAYSADYYPTLAAALIGAKSGDTIQILAGTWGEDAIGKLDEEGEYTNANIVRYKSLTIQPAEGAEVTFTSTLSLGYDDSSTANATMTVKNLNFDGASLALSNYVQVNVEGCTFKNGTSNTAGMLIVQDSCCKNHKTTGDYPASQVTIKNCTIDGSNDGASGIRIRNSGNVTITGNVIKNTAHNGILFESNGSVDNTPVKTVSITGNAITEWDVGNVADGGRAMRLDFGTLAADSAVTIEGNLFRKDETGLDKPDFMKITGAGAATVSLEKNDWNNELRSTVSGNSDYYTVDTATPVALAAVVTTKKEPVAQIGETRYYSLQEAVEAAKIGDTITIIANDTSLSAPEGWTISGSTLIPVDKTWHIANLDQLKEFQSAVNGGNTFAGQTVVLDVDIDMASEENWTPVGNASGKKFAGTFDGQNHTISGLKITGGSYVGLFGYLGAATVQNVALVGANVSGVKRVGALVGQIAGDATIKNCSLDTTSSVAGSDSNTGGLIGEASGSIVVTLENLTNNAPVTNTESGTSRAAGILCQATSGASVTLKNCVNNGTITTNDGYAGGIVSAKQGGASLVFDGCSNTGTLANGTKGTGALLAWSCNGSSVTISNYSADVANAIGWLSQDNYDHVFVINGVEHYIRVAKGGAGYTFASRYEAARLMDESYLQEIIGFFNYAKTVNANFEGYPATPVEVLKSAYNTRDESIKGGLFNTDVSSGWPQLLSQYNATSGKSLTADDFAVTWGTRDVLFMVGDAVAKIGNTYYVALADALVAVGTGDVEEITLLKNVSTDAAIIVNKVIAIDLNGKTIAATQNDTAGDGVFCVVAPGVLTINDSVGTGVINGVGDNNYNMAIWAKDGGKVVINGGNFTNVGATDKNVGATDKNDPNAHFDLIYVKNGGDVVINGGHFECETPAFTLNSHDTYKGTITVNGGTFVGFDPRNNAAETAGTTFMAPGKFTMANGNNYVVVEPGSYMLNEAYCAKGSTVADIDAAVAGAVTLTTIDGVITAKATFTFKVTAVDTVNPENSLYELTGGTLRPGKTVAVKYIDLATGEESWEKPESDTVTFKLVIK